MKVVVSYHRSNSLKESLLAHLVADKANFASSPFAVPACFVLLVYGLSWMIEVPAALTALGLLHVHVSKGLQTLAQLTPAVAALITAGLFNGRRAIGPVLLPLLQGAHAVPLLRFGAPRSAGYASSSPTALSEHGTFSSPVWSMVRGAGDGSRISTFQCGRGTRMERFLPAQPDERQLAAGRNGLDGAVLGILASAVLPRGQLRRSKHLAPVPALSCRYLPCFSIFRAHLLTNQKRVSLPPLPRISQCWSGPLVRPAADGTIAALRALDRSAMDCGHPRVPHTYPCT